MIGCPTLLAGAATSIIFVATKRDKHVFVETKHVFCLDKSNVVLTFVVTKYFCRDKTFLATKLSRDKHVHTFRTTKDLFCCDKHVLTLCCLSEMGQP